MNCKEGVCYLKKSSSSEEEIPMPLPTSDSSWLMYGADWCGFCIKAKEELAKKEEKSTYVDVDKYGGGTKVKHILKDRVGSHNTIPMIFLNEKFIGGYNELRTYKQFVCGGIGETKPMTDEVRGYCNEIKEDVEKEFGNSFSTYIPHSYKSQLVAGWNYFAKIEIDNKEFMHVRMYKRFDDKVKYARHVYPKCEHEEIDYF